MDGVVGIESRKEALVVCGEQMIGGITIWDLETGEVLRRIPTCASPPHGLLCLQDHLLVASQLQRDRPFSGGAIFFWALNKPQTPFRSYPIEAIGPIAGSKDGVYLAGGASSGKAYIWEVASGRLLKCWQSHEKCLNCIVFSGDDSLLISGSEDGIICVWFMISVLNVEDPRTCGSLPCVWSEHGFSISGLIPISGGSSSLVISSSLDGTCKVWDLVSGRLLQTHIFSVAIMAIAVNPGEQLLFSGGDDGRVHVRELNVGLEENPTLASEEDTGVLQGHMESITALTFSLGGSWLISASKDCTICVWDARSWQIIQKFNSVKGHITNLLMIPRSALSKAQNQRTCLQPHISLLEKTSHQNFVPEGTLTILPTYCSWEDHLVTSVFRASSLLTKHIVDIEQGRTPEAIQMRVETIVESRLWTVTMTKHITTINKHLQARLLDMIQYRLCNDSEVPYASKRKVKNVDLEEPSDPPE